MTTSSGRQRSLCTAGLVVALALLGAACVPLGPPPPLGPFPADIAAPPNSPSLNSTHQSFVTTTFNGASNVPIDHPWDISFIDANNALFTERGGRISLFNPATGGVAKLVGTTANTLASGESGLMGIAVDPQFATNNFIYVCVSSTSPTNNNQIRRYTVNLAAPAGAGLSGETLMLPGMPVSSFHDGCRIRFDPGTGPAFGTPPALFITMGDAGMGPGPQDLGSLAGKILRVEVDTGAVQPYPGNPFVPSGNSATDLIYTYGHRNPQGMAFQPGSNAPYNSEHGPTINDEVNRLVAGGNAGWNPNTNGAYDQSHPMTDVNLPNVFGPVWRSGDSFTLAPSGATFLSGAQWKAWNGALAVAFLKDSKVRIMLIDGSGAVTGSVPVLALGKRVRSVAQGPDGNLYVTTDMGGGNDAIWKVVPT